MKNTLPRKLEIPSCCIEFYKKDEEYRAWLQANPDGYVMNNYRKGNGPIPAFRQPQNAMTIHHVTEGARHLIRSDTMSYRKLCCTERKPLEDFRKLVFAVINAPKGVFS
ncbi:MAG: hypothetical protein OXF43_08025 [Gammaproteobacteria bacterium]|nr:hypothetical protein [Gammaproteobacteria bacterium]